MSRADRPPVRWDESGTPHSTEFNDIYRSQSPAGGGLAQAREVFLRGCGLLDSPPAWANARVWTLLETGFGLGLNALATWQAWRQDPQRPDRLHVVSIESSPVTATDLLRSVQDWPDLHDLAQTLARAWWGMGEGQHRLSFEGGRVCFTLVIAPIETLVTPRGLAGLDCVADSVFLDGFSPKLNPGMWSPETLRALGAHTRVGTRVSSWCVAAELRQTLTDLGFEVSREPGLAPKRHRLQAVRTAPAVHARATRTPAPSVWVLGAGLAGAALAREWADRGIAVKVLDSGSGAAQGASGLPIGLFAPHGARQRPELGALTLAGLRHMHALAERLLQRGVDWSASGVLEQLMPDRRGKLPPLPLPGDDTAEVQSGLPGHAHPSLLHARAGWIKPQALVHALLDHPLIECSYGVEVSSLKRTPSGQWQALGPQGQVVTQAPVACLAAGAGSIPLLSQLSALSERPAPAQPLGLHAVRGQVSLMPQSAFAQAGLPDQCTNGHGSWIPHVVFQGLAPQAVFGSGFDHQRLDQSVHESDHRDNLRRLSELFPAADLGQVESAPWVGWSGVRCTSPDRLPWCGPWPDTANAPDLWVLTALGARGLTLGALLAHALVCEALGEPSALNLRWQQALRPGRARGASGLV